MKAKTKITNPRRTHRRRQRPVTVAMLSEQTRWSADDVAERRAELAAFTALVRWLGFRRQTSHRLLEAARGRLRAARRDLARRSK